MKIPESDGIRETGSPFILARKAVHQVVIESPRNALVHQISQLRSARERRFRAAVLADVPHLVEEGIAAGWRLRTLLCTTSFANSPKGAELLGRVEGTFLRSPDWPLPAETVLVSERVLASIGTTDAPQGIVGVFAVPPPDLNPDVRYILALDRVQDPGNVGALVRSALGLCGRSVSVLVGAEGADPYGPKALRASAGACFHVRPVVVDNLAAEVRGSAPRVDWWSLMPTGGVPLAPGLGTGGPIGLIVGNEGRGVSPELLEASRPLTIPLPGPVESLNASIAGALALYTLCLQ